MMKQTLIIGASALMLTACVSKKQYDELQNKFNQVYSDNQGCQTELASARSTIDGLKQQLNQYEGRISSEKDNLKSLQEALKECLAGNKSGQANVYELTKQIESSNKYIQRLVNSKNKSDSLNLVLTNNLTKSLSKEELRDVDVVVQKGVVFISLSDKMLYKSGSYEISSAATETLAKIAKIIKDYPDYDVLIEGNTDNVPISKKNIRNNWDLSALRASSVVQALQNEHGVNPKRMTAGGRGQYNPLESNDTESGRARNRRTQIIILPELDEFMKLIEKDDELK